VKKISNQNPKAIQPFLKWAGNKKSIIHRIIPLLPKGKRLIEPFCGSAAVFLNTDYEQNLIADNNQDLINLFLQLQQQPKNFINYCQRYFLEDNNNSQKYYQLRDNFNQTSNKKIRAALFLYLNKHGFNGLCRYNKSGIFNVPFGLNKAINLPEERMFYFSEQAHNAQFITTDFISTIKQAKKGDVIYCDPPYVPANNSNSSFQYGKYGFNFEQQKLLAIIAEQTADKGIPVLISNHHTEFTEEIYQKAESITFNVKRKISCKSNQRQEAREVLALFK
jgi:DNA adenine methylase